MKKIFLILIAMVILPLNICLGITTFTYSLKQVSIPYTIDDGKTVFPTTVSDPNKEYVYNIDLSTNGFQGQLPTMRFTFSLVNGKFSDGKTIMKMSYDSLQLYKLHVKWDDITSNSQIDTAYTAIIKITEGIVIDDPTNFGLQKGQVQQFVRKIASLKGQIPSLGAGPNRLINDISQMLASVTDMEYPGINEGTGSKLVKQFEWTLPAGWRTTSDQYGTFTTNPDVKQITIIPDKVNVGSIKVRAVNDIASAYSEYDSIYFDRGLSFTNYPTSIPFGDYSPRTFSTTLFSGVTYEWSAPSGWQINGQGNNLEALNLNSVNVTPSFCAQTDGRVRLRLKKDGDISLWYDFKDYQGVTDPTITSNTSPTYQYEESLFTINNINPANIQSISCSDNRVCSAGNQGSNFKIIYLQSGTITVNISVLMTGCSTPVLFPVTTTVLPHRISIIGPSQLCNQGTYTISNLPIGATVSWSSSPNGFLQLVSGQGTSTAIFNKILNKYNNIISASISICGNSFTVYKSGIQTGTPYSAFEIYDAATEFEVTRVFVNKNYYFFGIENAIEDDDYQWTITSPSPYPVTTAIDGRQAYYTASKVGSHLVTLQYNGACGWSDIYSEYVYFESSKKTMLALSPNPASELVTVEVTEDTLTENSLLSLNNPNQSTSETDYQGFYEIQLWNENSGLIKTLKSEQSTLQIPLRGLPKGMYYVHLIIDGKTIQKKILWIK